jgi:membrane protein YdbS with pleckstrin-like domain
MTNTPQNPPQSNPDRANSPASSDQPAIGAPVGESASDRFRQATQPRPPDAKDKEEDLWVGGFSGKAMLGSWLLAGLVTVALLVGVLLFGPGNTYLWLAWVCIAVLVWGGLGLLLLYRKITVRYHLTTQRFIHESGFLKRVTDRIEVIDIDDVSFEQGLIERMVGVGSIRVISSDRSHPDLWMRGIDGVKEIAGLIDDIRRKERRLRGVHIEAV